MRRRRPTPWKFLSLEHRVVKVFRELLDGRTWKRHAEPWSKTEAGRKRRAERKFVRACHHSHAEGTSNHAH